MNKVLIFIVTKTVGLVLNAYHTIAPKNAVQLAYYLFSHPLKGKLNSKKLPNILQTANLEMLDCNGINFATYQWIGNKTTILLVHGWESNAGRWEKLIPYLQKTGATLLAIDAPAHGLSSGTEFSIPDYAHCIETVVQKYQPNYVIGHSLGGKACLYHQWKYPKNTIQKLILLGAPSDFEVLLQNYYKLLRLKKAIIIGIENKYILKYKQQLHEFSAAQYCKNLTIAGIIAHDLHDKVVTINEAKKIAHYWQNALYIQTQGLTHSMHDVNLYQKIVTFINKK